MRPSPDRIEQDGWRPRLPMRRSALLGALALLAWLPAIAVCAQSTAPRIALIFDDLGYQHDLDQRILALHPDVAVAIIPDAPAAARLAEATGKQGRETLIHLPVSGNRQKPCHPLLACLHAHWDLARMVDHLQAQLMLIPNAVGINNHEGSDFATSKSGSSTLMAALATINQSRSEPIYFLDSRTTPESRLESAARRLAVPAMRRDVFIDASRNPEAMRNEWQRLLRLARTQGHAVGIGHPFPETLALIEREIGKLDEQGIILVRPSELLKGH